MAALADAPETAIVANLPYNIATPLLIGWLTEPWPPWWQSLTLMFQREVAERIVAPPGSKTYGRLGVLAGWRTEARDRCSTFRRAPSRRRRRSPRRSCISCRARRPCPAIRRCWSGSRGRLRPAPQDAAPEPEVARARSGDPARRGRHRRHPPRRGDRRRRLRRARQRRRGVTSPPARSTSPAKPRLTLALLALGGQDRAHPASERCRSSLTITYS
jgi:hypothetical protein